MEKHTGKNVLKKKKITKSDEVNKSVAVPKWPMLRGLIMIKRHSICYSAFKYITRSVK